MGNELIGDPPSKACQDICNDAAGWIADNARRVPVSLSKIEDKLAKGGALLPSTSAPLTIPGHMHYQHAIVAAMRADRQAMRDELGKAYCFSSLEIRLIAQVRSVGTTSAGNLATGLARSVCFGDWDTAQRLFEIGIISSRRQREQSEENWSSGYGRQNFVGFVLGLYAGAFGQEMDFERTYVPERAALLEALRGDDPAAFAAPFEELVRLREANWLNPPEGVSDYYSQDIIFPWDLMAPLALREKLGRPAFSTGDARIDAIWDAIRGVTWEPADLQKRIEARAKADYPHFR